MSIQPSVVVASTRSHLTTYPRGVDLFYKVRARSDIKKVDTFVFDSPTCWSEGSGTAAMAKSVLV